MRKKLRFSPEVFKNMKQPSQPVTGPMSRIRERGTEDAPAPPRVSRMTLPLFRVFTWTLGGAAVLGSAAWAFGSGLFGLGFFLGGFLALFNLYSLKALTTKVIATGDPRGLWIFHGMNLARWLFMAILYLVLLKISLACLLGAVACYIWFLGVLGWFGVRSAQPVGNPDAK